MRVVNVQQCSLCLIFLGMLSLRNNIFLTDIIVYDQLKFS